MNIKGIIKGIDEAVFPSNIYCMLCGAMIDASRPYSLCDECVKKMHWINEGVQEDGSVQRVCAKCGKALPPAYRGKLCYDCMTVSHYFEKGFSCLTYGLHERELMMDLKYNGRSSIATKMGEVMFDRMASKLITGVPDADGVIATMQGADGVIASDPERLVIDVVVPVPVSAERLRKRGYNQAAIMAKAFVRKWREARSADGAFAKAPELRTGALRRTKNTQMLRGLNPSERALAMKGAFEVTASGEKAILGKTVLLIDDIYTTGATADACSLALIEKDAKKVYVLTLASGGNRRPTDTTNLL